MNLLCIPYAGATPLCYQYLKKYLPDWLSLTTAVLPGRGGNKEEACVIFSEIVEDIFERYKYIFEKGNYALFGHSMGSTIVYELTYRIIEEGLPKPEHLFFSGRVVPEQSYQYAKITDENKEEFFHKVVRLGGIHEELLNYPEALKYFMKQIYEDYILIENYSYTAGRDVFDIDISVFYGQEDELFSQKESFLWKKTTKKKCNLYGFSGNHFFLEKHAEQIVKIICKELCVNRNRDERDW